MRGGYRIIDADTHFHPTLETIEPYFGPELRARIDEIYAAKNPQRVGWAGEEMPKPYRHLLRFRDSGGWGSAPPRHLGEAGPRANEERHYQRFMGYKMVSLHGADFDIDARIRDMDEEGIDVQVMVPSVGQGHADPAVDVALIQSLHRYIDDVCSHHPGRLTALIQATARDVDGSVEEIRRWAKAPWAAGVLVSLPIDFPIDHPDLHPIWRVADEFGLCIAHHSFSTGYPGYRDLWDNPFVGRTASHPWGAMRMVAAFLGAGLFDQYPNIRLSILESGFGWLPFWMKRMEDQVVYMGYVADLKHSMTEYMTGGRFFAAVVLHEGEEMVRLVSEAMGDGVLMFSSDYPHSETRFPRSADIVLGWESLGKDHKTRLFSENAIRCFGID